MSLEDCAWGMRRCPFLLSSLSPPDPILTVYSRPSLAVFLTLEIKHILPASCFTLARPVSLTIPDFNQASNW